VNQHKETGQQQRCDVCRVASVSIVSPKRAGRSVYAAEMNPLNLIRLAPAE